MGRVRAHTLGVRPVALSLLHSGHCASEGAKRPGSLRPRCCLQHDVRNASFASSVSMQMAHTGASSMAGLSHLRLGFGAARLFQDSTPDVCPVRVPRPVGP
eukprot:5770261-Prymnesium_polylepis.1